MPPDASKPCNTAAVPLAVADTSPDVAPFILFISATAVISVSDNATAIPSFAVNKP